MNNWFVYILQCNDRYKSLYTGISNDVEKRIEAHNAKRGAKYTKTRLPVKLLKQLGPFTKSEASKLEYKIKQLSRKDKLK